MIKKISKQILIAFILMLTISCSRNRNVLFTDSAVMPGATWSLFDIPDFRIPVNDTLARTNVFFNIRTGSAYPFRNIWLFITATAPDGKNIMTDTLQYDLADQKGRWYGHGIGDIHELKLPFRQNVFFPMKGTYHFRIQHGMRIGNLKGVYDIGVRVEKISR